MAAAEVQSSKNDELNRPMTGRRGGLRISLAS